MKNITAPVVLVTALALTKIRTWTKLAAGEFSALGTVLVRDGSLLVTDVHLVEQVSSHGSTVMDDAGLARLLIDLEAAGEDSSMLRLWVHSHGVMEAFWSGTDERCIHGLNNHEWVLSWVTNKAGDDRLRLDLYEPIRVTLDHLKLQVHLEDLGLGEWCAEQFADKVDERPPMLRRGTRAGGLVNHHRRLEPPWPTDEEFEDGDQLTGPGEGWWEGDEWALPDDDQLVLQVDDPWGRALALGVR